MPLRRGDRPERPGSTHYRPGQPRRARSQGTVVGRSRAGSRTQARTVLSAISGIERRADLAGDALAGVRGHTWLFVGVIIAAWVPQRTSPPPPHLSDDMKDRCCQLAGWCVCRWSTPGRRRPVPNPHRRPSAMARLRRHALRARVGALSAFWQQIRPGSRPARLRRLCGALARFSRILDHLVWPRTILGAEFTIDALVDGSGCAGAAITGQNHFHPARRRSAPPLHASGLVPDAQA